ncbi:LysM peptidoglycan-binding domain-containing protein [Alsobacter sp. KACC 23698]|uniref:LysM peptidoglycan-binding domain-containing protein n=1 Tax=Alsobacter sp. KACC 23698 TaxID=3149229 RepID=A0AAU7JII0_9HYPH
MLGWIKIAALLGGVAFLGGLIAVFGLPSNLARNAPPAADVPAVAPSPGAAPSAGGGSSPGGASAGGTMVTVPPVASMAPAGQAPVAQPSAGQQVAAAPAGSVPASGPAASLAAPAAPADSTVPSFDIVRVEPAGDAVIAGRGVPGAVVELLRNGQVHDRAQVDASGHFAMVPPRLPPGAQDLTLAVTPPGGKRELSTQSVTVSVPDKPNGEVIVALASPDKPTQILSRTPPASPAPNAPPGALAPGQVASAGGTAAAPSGGPRSRVLLSTVEADETGKFFATGQAAPGASVRLYLNDTFLATAKAAPDGKWSFTIARGLEHGVYRVRVDDVDAAADGKVLSRAEAPFDYTARVASLANSGAVAAVTPAPAPAPSPDASAPGDAARPGPASRPGEPAKPGEAGGHQVASADGANVVVPEIRTTLVARGDSLWRISKKTYGSGLRYTVIYDANQQQIRDADLIYPGQMFVIPGQKQP